MMEIDIDRWMSNLQAKLAGVFGSRLVLLGVQGSRARGEARESSDIDAVVVIERLTPEDIEAYRKIVATMPHAQLACGFIGSSEVLAAWPRHDVFNLVNDTRVLAGSFDFMDTNFTREDALLAAKAGVSEVYHALCHTMAFEPETLPVVVEACVKNAFFIMRALVFARTSEYPRTRARMRELATGQERALLDAYDAGSVVNDAALAADLIAWAHDIIVQA